MVQNVIFGPFWPPKWRRWYSWGLYGVPLMGKLASPTLVTTEKFLPAQNSDFWSTWDTPLAGPWAWLTLKLSGDVRTHGRMDGKSPHSTGFRPLSGPLPCYSPTITQKLYKAGQGYRWPYDASWRLVITVGHSLIPHPSIFGHWFTGNSASK